MTSIPFAQNAYTLDQLPVSAQECTNAFPEREPADAKTPVAVFGVPGLTAFASAANGPIRGMILFQGVVYAVSGMSLYSISAAGVTALVGSGIAAGSGPVGLSQNGSQLCITDGTNGFIYDGSTFTVITDPDYHAASTVTFFDDYFVFDRRGTNFVFLSGLLDGTSYGALDTAAAEVQPQDVLATVNQQESLLVFSTGHIETWYDSGAVSFPFQRIDGATIERGLAATYTPCKEDNSVFFLGDDLVFYRLDGVIPRRVSTHALEQSWQEFSTVADAFCFSMTIAGHKQVFLTFPTGNRTYVYDIASGLWHRRQSDDANGNDLGRWRGNCHIRAYGKDLVGDAFNGQICFVDSGVFTECDVPVRMVLVSPPTQQDRKRVFYANFELDMETGVGLPSGQGSDPQVMLEWSNDGSRSWSQIQPWRSLGKIGEYTQRVRWPGPLGQARQRTWRVTVSDPVRRTLIAARCDIQVGM